MKKSLINGLAASALVLSALTAKAADELVIYVFKDGEAAADITVRVDGQTEKPLSQNGSAMFDLDEGAHSIQLIQNGQTVHSFRFDSALGQLVDINVALSAASNPKVAVESFFKTESASNKANAPKGLVQGQIKSQGAPVANATVAVDGVGETVVTDAEGNYKLELPRGVYSLTVSHPDMKLVELEDVRVVSNVTKGLAVNLSPKGAAPSLDLAAPQIEEVTVVAKYNPGAFEADERFSSNVIDTLGIEQLARFGDSDVSASVVRLPSVTVQNSSYVFIRGLGGRYVTTTLNGSTLPSTNPNRRAVPLDLFPSNIVSQLDVKKTFLAEQPGESTGGNLVINTRTFPDEGAGKVSFKVGYTDGLTGESVASDPSTGEFDFLGFDDGSRRESLAVEAISIALDPTLQLGLDPTPAPNPDVPQGVPVPELDNALTPEQEIQLSQAAALLLTDDLTLDSTTATPDISFSANYGDLFYLGENEVGYFAALNYKNGWDQKTDGIARTYRDNGIDIFDDRTFEEATFKVNISGLVSFGLNAGNSTYEANTVFSRVTENAVRIFEGIDGDAGEPTRGYSIDWEEQQFLAQQLSGEHFLDDAGNLTANWQGTISQTTRYAPDRREVQFNQDDQANVNSPFRLELSNLLRRFDELEEYNYDISNEFEWLATSNGSFDQTINFGWQYTYRERDSESSSYSLTYTGTDPDFTLAPNGLVTDVVNEDNVTGDPFTGLAFDDDTLASDSYDSELTLISYFVSYDLLINSAYQLVFGVRYEDFELETDTFSLQTGEPTSDPLIEEAVLPSLNFSWTINDQHQLRFALTETVSRPDFKEFSNATFYDKEFNTRTRGNPNLEIATVLNADVRWEYYWSDTENVSVALFYKDFEDPIERTILPAGGAATDSRTFANVPEAELFGIELDTHIEFPLNNAFTQTIFVSGNASFIESEVTFANGTTGDLQGAPEYTFNLVLGWDDLESQQEVTVLFNQNGDTVVDRGLGSLDDVVQEPFAALNVNYKKGFDNGVSLSAKINNLLDSEFEFSQGGRVFQSYSQGVKLEAGIDWSF